VSLFVNVRAGNYGALCDAYVIEGDPLVAAPAMKAVPYENLAALVGGKDVLLAAHGFNVNYVNGLHSLGRLETLLAPHANEVVMGVLWPGDWALPAINYPFEDKVAAHAGQLLAAFCNRWLTPAASLSFASHSLGARVVLEAVAALQRRTHSLCIAAGAIGADCLTAHYKAAAANCDALITLSSMKDVVLALAFPPGDIIADILNLDHKPFQRALGRRGPQSPYGPPIKAAQIADAAKYNHGDYLPPSDLSKPAPDPRPEAKWPHALEFMQRAFRSEPQSWPA
jgi:hypothetical protein